MTVTVAIGTIVALGWFGFMSVTIVDVFRANFSFATRSRALFGVLLGSLLSTAQIPYAISDRYLQSICGIVMIGIAGVSAMFAARFQDRAKKEAQDNSKEEEWVTTYDGKSRHRPFI